MSGILLQRLLTDLRQDDILGALSEIAGSTAGLVATNSTLSEVAQNTEDSADELVLVKGIVAELTELSKAKDLAIYSGTITGTTTLASAPAGQHFRVYAIRTDLEAGNVGDTWELADGTDILYRIRGTKDNRRDSVTFPRPHYALAREKLTVQRASLNAGTTLTFTIWYRTEND